MRSDSIELKVEIETLSGVANNTIDYDKDLAKIIQRADTLIELFKNYRRYGAAESSRIQKQSNLGLIQQIFCPQHHIIWHGAKV